MVQLQGNRIGQGRDNAREYLKNNPSVATEIEHAIIEAYRLTRQQAAEAGVDDSFSIALKYAIKLRNGYRDRSMSEMRQKLTGKGFSGDIVDNDPLLSGGKRLYR